MAQAMLTWNANNESDLAGYKVYRSLGIALPSVLTTLGKVTNYTDVTIPNVNQSVSYQLSAFDLRGNESATCSAVVVTIDVSPPTVPSGLAVTVQVSVTVTP